MRISCAVFYLDKSSVFSSADGTTDVSPPHGCLVLSGTKRGESPPAHNQHQHGWIKNTVSEFDWLFVGFIPHFISRYQTRAYSCVRSSLNRLLWSLISQTGPNVNNKLSVHCIFFFCLHVVANYTEEKKKTRIELFILFMFSWVLVNSDNRYL